MNEKQAPYNLRLALYQPDIAGNTGAIIRLCASLGIALDIIEPCGFVWDANKMARAAMDYLDLCAITRHMSWDDFYIQKKGRIVLLTTRGSVDLYDFQFRPNDVLLAGRESAGVPDEVHAAADARIKIPMHGAARSLNIGHSCAIVAGEAIRQMQ